METTTTSIENVLAAGGVVDTTAKVPAGQAVDEVTARAYAHPALGDRRVIRVAADKLAPALDAEMAFVGFGAGESLGVVGKKRRATIGFPAWPLLHDPAKSKYAMDVFADFRAHAERARSKPGHARDGFLATAVELGRTAPHFLPSFFEEAARVFVAQGNLKLASTCFEKARDAERVHALKVDELSRRESFLEFALAGAVSNGSLGDYAKELVKSRSAEEGYVHFRELCLLRALGGKAPWRGMAKELRALAKGAKRDVAAEDASFIAEILEAPALGKSAPDFWTSYEKAIVEVAKGSPRVRGLLLDLFPPSPETTFFGWWLEVLEKAGAFAVMDQDVPPEARPAGTLASWFSRLSLACHVSHKREPMPARAFELLRRAQKRLVAEGKPIAVWSRGCQVHIDWADLALELGIPIEPPVDHLQAPLSLWAQHVKAPEHGRALTHLSADARYMPLLVEALWQSIGDAEFEAATAGNPGLLATKHRWLNERLERAAHSLPLLEDELTYLEKRTTPQLFAELPGAAAALRALDVATPLARTLQGGIYDELGWKALDEAIASLKGKPAFHGAFPHVVVTDGTKAIVLGPKGKVFEYDFTKKHALRTLRYVGDQLLVGIDERYSSNFYWSKDPSKIFDSRTYRYHADDGQDFSVGRPDGSVVERGRAMRAGDTEIRIGSGLRYDGKTFWRNAGYMVEFDPETGEDGRKSLPAWIEAYAGDGVNVMGDSWVFAAPEGLERSPFGLEGGLLGLRVRIRTAAAPGAPMREAESIDGKQWSTPKPSDFPLGLLRFPGSDAVASVTQLSRNDQRWGIHDAAGRLISRVRADEDSALSHSAGVPLPAPWWHLLAYRDEASSTALRKTDVAAARALLDAAVEDLPGLKRGTPPVATRAAVEAALPAVKDAKVADGIAAIARLAAVAAERLAALVATHAPSGAGEAKAGAGAAGAKPLAAAANVERMSSSTFKDATGWLGYWASGSLTDQAMQTGAFFAREARSADPIDDAVMIKPGSADNWWSLLGSVGGIMHLAASPFTRAEDRDVIVRALRILVASGLLDRKLQIYLARVDPSAKARLFTGELKDRGAVLCSEDGHDYLLHDQGMHWCTILESARGEDFRSIPGSSEAKGHIEIPPRRAAVESFLETLQARGPYAWDPARAAQLASRTGMSIHEAKLVLAGFPSFWSGDKNFLPTALRETLDMKVADATAARITLQAKDAHVWTKIYAAAALPDPRGLWAMGEKVDDGDSAIERVAREYVAHYGQKVALPEALVSETFTALDTRGSLAPPDVLPFFVDPDAAKMLTVDARWRPSNGRELVAVDAAGQKLEPHTYFGETVLWSLLPYLPYLFEMLPVGDPMRDKIPRVVELVLERLRAESTSILVSQPGLPYGEALLPALQAYVEAFGGEEVVGDAIMRVRGPYELVVGAHTLLKTVRTAKLRTKEEVAEVDAEPGASNAWRAASRFLRGELDEIVSRVKKTPVPAGKWEDDPVFSVPEIVTKVRKKHDLSEEAAALYLQTLALPAPTTKHVCEHNGWSPAQYKKAAAELTARKLLVEAKRARAQRSHFLPGGWEPLEAPFLPLELWKVPLYRMTIVSKRPYQEDFPRGTASVLLSLRPSHRLFEMAWKRIEDGDEPRMQDIPGEETGGEDEDAPAKAKPKKATKAKK